MTTGLIIAVLAAAIVLIVLVLIVGPWSRAIYRDSKLHGPVSTPSLGGTGAFFGWIASGFWSAGEQIRQENYEYNRLTAPTPFDLSEPESWSPPIHTDAPLVTLPEGRTEFPRSEQHLSEDGRYWWSGHDWEPIGRFAPPSAERSVDGSTWWDGHEWQWVPGEWPDASTWTPTPAETEVRHPRRASTWIVSQRRHLAKRRNVPIRRDPDRSDRPPDWLDS